MSVKTFAAIDVGSFEITMKIYELSGKNVMRQIDCVSKHLAIGSDTYADGKISNEKLDELCRILKDFSVIMNTYKVAAYKAYGTSAIREAHNTLIVLDQIEQRTGIRVEMLSNSEQRFLDYKSAASRGESFRKIIEEKTAILSIGGGSIQISLFDNDTLVSTQNLRLGVLRIRDFLDRYASGKSQAEVVIREMAMAQLAGYKKLYLKDREIKNLIVIDDYVSPLVVKKNAKDGVQAMMEPGELPGLVEQLRTVDATQAAQKLGISAEKIPLVFVSAVLTGCIADLMDVKRIYVPGVSLCDGIVYEYAEKTKLLKDGHNFEQDIIACAMNISRRYQGSRKREDTLESIAMTIFDSMKKIHGLGKREQLYLRLAAILNDCGKYISMVNVGENGYQIIMATEIIGLSHTEREIVANVVRFHHSRFVYYGQQQNPGGLDRESYLTMAKLTAILRLASGLDRSHKQKLKNLKAVLKDNRLVLSVTTQEDITLEKGFFEDRGAFFREVFSVEPILKQHKNM